jgi:hypothetical protein
VALVACGGEEGAQTLEEQAAAKCPKVHLDKMAGDWLQVTSGTMEPGTRARFTPTGQAYEMLLVNGGFTKHRLQGTRQKKDIKFLEVPGPEKQKRFDDGHTDLKVVYVKPDVRTCTLKFETGYVNKDGKETIKPGSAKKWLPWPAEIQETYSWQPKTGDLFLGESAKDRERADKEREENQGPLFQYAETPVPTGIFTASSADGSEDCSYDMDVFLDDKRLQEKVPAGEVADGYRHWYFEFDADWEGNVHFELQRYRTCAGGSRELIGVAALEAVLM